MKSIDLLEQLKRETQEFILFAEGLKKSDPQILLQKPSEKAWNCLECLEHLNLYGDFYLPEIKRCLENYKRGSREEFSHSRFGAKVVRDILPLNDGSLKSTMNTFKNRNPSFIATDLKAIDRFSEQQNAFLNLLEKAKDFDLVKIKTKTTLPLIKFRLGTTLQFLVNHNRRHLVQAQKALNI